MVQTIRRAAFTAALLGVCAVGQAAAAPAAGPLQRLQSQIDALISRFVPPTLSHVLVCKSALEAELTLTAQDADEVAMLAIQEQGGDPPANFVIFVEPGLESASHSITLEPGPEERRLLLVGADRYGNTARTLVILDATACAAP